MTAPSKPQLLEALLARLEATLQSLVDSQRSSQEGATHEEAKPEHAKDTRATEASYLARGLSQRVEALQSQIEALGAIALRTFDDGDRVALTALVEIADDDGEITWIWLVPVGGGERLRVDDGEVRCATPSSPIGRSLLDREVGDEVVLDLPSGRRTFEISSVR